AAGAPTLRPKGALPLPTTAPLPPVQFSAANFSVVEGQLATIGITRTGSGTGTVTVHYATVDGGTAVSGTDYAPTSGTATVAAGVVKKFTVPTVDDGLLAGSRDVLLSLHTPG